MAISSRRRWFRFAFSLRTLFVVVTIFGVWLGWNLNIVRERKRLVGELETHYPGSFTDCYTLEGARALAAAKPDPEWFGYIRVSALRRLLGDESFLSIVMPSTVDPKLVRQIEHAFPEAQLTMYGEENGKVEAFRASLYLPLSNRPPNTGTIFKTGLIEK